MDTVTEEFSLNDLTFVHGDNQYLAKHQGVTAAFAAYTDEPGTDEPGTDEPGAGTQKVRDFNHTVTSPEFGGKGVAGALVKYALDDSIAAGYRIVPTCSYVQHFIDKHPEYKEHLA